MNHKLLLAASAALLLSSCKKNKEFCWDCTGLLTDELRLDGQVTYSKIGAIDEEVCDKTVAEIRQYEKDKSFDSSGTKTAHGVLRDSTYKLVVTCVL